jgi:hypothetical protein
MFDAAHYGEFSSTIEQRMVSRRIAMACKSCQSSTQTLFPSEICIHFPGGLEALSKQPVFVFPQLLICLNCGFTECSVPEDELRGMARVLAEKPRRKTHFAA